ncbi:bifunctional hydroxymethylpyrimidine kinase/phosphomethylpyrimidine kinase [Nitriliruptoraceae bacterium ZYF776]|nr:bifunctional hydroxymethylpyrimidine kinase/phosphomethylpyrimidine kinase [Profundirhabdus halotolerans]
MSPADGGTPPVALTIAGSDSGGGAGIQADLQTFAGHGVFGASVLTALTAQDTRGVHDVHLVPATHVTAQLDAVLGDLPVAAVKTGMLATAELVALVADRAAAGELPNLVVDPVLVAASGARLLDEDAVGVYRDRLLPHATVVTPNLPEAAALLGRPVTTLADAHAAARELADLGPRVVVVKGGHLPGEADAIDSVVVDGRLAELGEPRVATGNVHGTGCTFAAAVASHLAAGADDETALVGAKAYVTSAIAQGAGWQLGAGPGPICRLPVGPSRVVGTS